jgi:hypothetical protein
MKAGLGGLKRAVVAAPPSAAVLAPDTLPPGTVLKLQYRRPGTQAWTDVAAGSTVYILKDAAVQFKVLTHGGDPALVAKVVLERSKWTIANNPSGQGATLNKTFTSTSPSAAAPTEVKATYGANNVSINAVVFALNLLSTPVDNFAGRSQDDLGVNESVNLSFTTTPAGLTAAQVGGLRWQFPAGTLPDRRTVGLLHVPGTTIAPPANDGLANFMAPIRTHPDGALLPGSVDVSIQLTVLAGPSSGLGATRTFRVHKPQAHMTEVAGQPHHWNPPGGTELPSAGFVGRFHFTPKNVSFASVGFREGTGAMKSDGLGGDEAGIVHAPTNNVVIISGGNSVTGCTLGGTDNIHSAGNYAPGAKALSGSRTTRIGGKTWPIRWEYTYKNLATNDWSNVFIGMQEAYHTLTIFENGRAVMEKGHKKCPECTVSVSVDFGARVAYFWP